MIEQLDKKFIQFLTRQVSPYQNYPKILNYIGSSNSRDTRSTDTFCNKKEKKKELSRNTFRIFKLFEFRRK
jgi:hypothetical protein